MAATLDIIDRRILFELDKNARIAETKLAKIVGRSKESVRYRIKKLQDKGIIHGFTIWIDLSLLGFTNAKIYFTLANKVQEKKRFLKKIQKDPRLFWVAFAEGTWNAGLTYFVKDAREFFDLKNSLLSEFSSLILESRTASVVEVNVCEKKCLFSKPSSWKTVFGKQDFIVLSTLEKKILQVLSLDARTPFVQIARTVNSSVDIVRARIKNMEKRGIIFKYSARIDVTALGYGFYKTFLYFRNLTPVDEARLMEYSRRDPNIIHLIKQISPWDIELESMCQDYAQYLQMVSNLTEEFADCIIKVETAIMHSDYVLPAQKVIFEK